MEIMKKSHIKSKFEFIKFGTVGADKYFNEEPYMITQRNCSNQNIPIVVLQVMPVGDDLVIIEYVEEKYYKETKTDVE